MADHVIVIHRWSDRYADYAAYLDHSASEVSYVTTRRAAGSVPPRAAAVRLVPCTEDRAALRRAVGGLIEQFGRPSRIVALHEADLDVAAELRQALGVPGETPETLAPFRDKLVMARRMAAAGIPLPATAAAPDHAAVHAFAAVHGWPVLLKPVRGTASVRITRVDSAVCLDEFAFPPGVPMLVQSYLPYDVVHVDGVATGGASATGSGLGAWRASRYVNTCLDFVEGAPLGSVELDHPPLVRAIGELTERVVRAMSDEAWVFHLEFFISGDLDDPQLQLLEVAPGPGGAEVPFVWQEVHGIDLLAASFAVQTGAPLPGSCLSGPGPELGGWLLVPVPVPRPCRVVAAGPRDGAGVGDGANRPDGHVGPYARRVPRVGETLPNWPGYEHAGARFRFRGETGDQIEEAMVRTIQAFDFRCQPVETEASERVLLVGSAR